MSHLLTHIVRSCLTASLSCVCLTTTLHVAVAQEKPSPAETKATSTPEPSFSFQDLADPRVASELQLSDEQRSKIAALLKERSDALSKTAETDKPKVAEQNDSKLAELLTAEQKAILANLKPEPKLRFNFRSQKWADVLDWFAGQADMSLVLDAPPPGTFNYSDTREFTPTEAIDLLNGVLQTKGYTLIRRKRMLLVVNIAEGVPEGLVPSVSLQELDQRGKFELVSVMFPLGNRPAEEVAKEITPLLGPHGKAIPLPKTKQILVSDMAGIMRSVNAIITSIPEPQPPAKPPQPPVPEKPVLVAYPLKSADPNAAVEMLKVLVEPAKAVYDPKSQNLDVFGTPTQHAVVKSVLEQLQANNAPEKQPRLETYPLDTTDAAQLLENLKLVAPSAQMRVDAKTGSLIAWAGPDDHAKLKESIAKLGQGGSVEHARQVEVYPLTKADPATTLTLLQSLFPNARLSADVPTRKIIAVASPSDQKGIKTTIDQLQPEKGGPDTAELRFYPFEQAPPTSLTAILTALVPRATITPDNDGKRWTVLATPADHELIKATIDRFVTETGPDFGKEKNALEIYTVTPVQRKRFLSIQDSLSGELPGMRVVTSAEPGELAVWAKPSQHVVLKGILEKLVRDVPADAKQQLVAYSIKASDPASAMTLLQQLFPDVRIVVDAKTRRLLVWTRPEEHKLIESAIEQINSGVSADMLESFHVYPLKDVDPTIAVSMLQQLLPEVRLSSDTVAKTILVWGRKNDHATIEKTLKQMQDASQSKTQRTIVVYPAGKGDTGAILQSLRNMLPDSRIDDFPRAGKILAWATPEGHESIRQLLEKLAGAEVVEDAAEVVIYPVKSIGASAAIPILQALAPQARYTYGADATKLVVWANRADHATIKQVVEKIEAEAKPGDDRIVAVYPLFGANATTLSQLLAPFQTQGAQVVSDTTRDCLIIRATGEQQAAIKKAVEELTAKLPQEKKPTSHVYRFQNADPYAAATVLATLTPTARVAVDYRNRSLVVSALAEDHEKIAKTITEMDRDGEVAETALMKSYRVESLNPATLVGMLQTLFSQYPEVRFAADVPSGTIAVMATPAQHQKVQGVIDEVGKTEQGNSSHVYRFERADPYAALTVLQTMAPNARMAVDSRNRSLVVSASPAEHKKIAETVAQMDNADTKGGTPILRSYTLKSGDSYVTSSMLQTLFATSPEVRISLDTRNDSIVALASPAQHETIKATIDELETKEQGRTSQVYHFKNADPYAAYSVLATLTPRAQYAVDTRNRTLVVSATVTDHAKIKATVEQMESKDKEDQTPQLKSYSLKSSDPTSLVTMLQTLFATHPEVRFSVDAGKNAVVAIASSTQHETIAKWITEIDGSGGEGQVSKIEVYPLKDRNPDAVLAMMTNLMARQLPRVDLSIERNSNQLVAVARPDQHAMIRSALDRLETEKREFEVYQLEVIDPFTAELSIGRLFDTSGTGAANAPTVDSDSELQQLYVRGSKEQLQEVRELLVKMGETSLQVAGSGSGKRLRVIPFKGDAKAAISEIERVWPQLRKNSIRVVVPSAVAPLLRNGGKTQPPAQGDDVKSNHVEPPKKETPAAEPKGQFSVPAEVLSSSTKLSVESTDAAVVIAQNDSKAAPPAEPAPAETPTPAPDQKGNAQNQAYPPVTAPRPETEPKPPVIVAPGDGSITISSDDLEALDQLESLLHSMSRGPSNAVARDYTIFPLQNASAAKIALVLQQLFRTGQLGGRSDGRVAIVADDRLNAVVVRGGKSDREAIEQLLNVLDSADVPDSFATNRPKLIPIKNTEAWRIELILRDIYKAQLTQGGGRQPIPVPTGVSPQVAAAIQQANATSSGPLLTLGVDELTNSLVVMAPATLVEEIEKLVLELDTVNGAATSRDLTVIPLKKMNSESMQQVLQMIFSDQVRVRSGQSRTRTRPQCSRTR